MLKALLLDIDGTVHDSRETVYASIEQTMREFQLDAPSRADMVPYIHHVEAFFEHYAGGVALDTISDRFRELCNDERHELVVYEHAERTLALLRRRGLKLAAVSSSTHVRVILKRSPVGKLLDAVVDGAEVTNRKPHPEPLLLALKRLEVEAQDAVMVGDLPNDILAGKAAGVRATIGVTHGFGTPEALLAVGPDRLIDGLQELPAALEAVDQEVPLTKN